MNLKCYKLIARRREKKKKKKKHIWLGNSPWMIGASCLKWVANSHPTHWIIEQTKGKMLWKCSNYNFISYSTSKPNCFLKSFLNSYNYKVLPWNRCCLAMSPSPVFPSTVTYNSKVKIYDRRDFWFFRH